MRSVLILGALAGCSYEPPVIQQTTGLSSIAGEVVVAVPVEQVGDVVIFLSEATNPMPPYGTGLPVAATEVRASDFGEDASGLVSAPWAASDMPDGDYVITALMDVDGNFSPLVDAMSTATCGDIVGAHLDDITNQQLAPVHVDGAGIGTFVPDVTIVLAQEIPFAPPAFTGGDTVDSAAAAQNPTSQVYTLDAVGIHSSIFDVPGPEDFGPDSCGAIFPLYAPDEDGDGHFDPHPNPAIAAQGVFNVWPKVFLQYLGVPSTDDQGNTTYASGLAEGEAWAGENVPSPRYTLLGTLQPGQTVYEPSLDYVWLPAALHITPENPAGEIVQDVSQIPKGAWSITMISFTGQTWTIPNKLVTYPPTGDWDPSIEGGVLDVE